MPGIIKKILLSITAVIIAAIIGLNLWLNHRYFPIRDRYVGKSGEVVYEASSHTDWFTYEDYLKDFEREGLPRVREAVYYDHIYYCFTDEGIVFAFYSNGVATPVTIERRWKWEGKPEDFPWYGSVQYPGP